jgi:hypothetical protein
MEPKGEDAQNYIPRVHSRNRILRETDAQETTPLVQKLQQDEPV